MLVAHHGAGPQIGPHYRGPVHVVLAPILEERGIKAGDTELVALRLNEGRRVGVREPAQRLELGCEGVRLASRVQAAVRGRDELPALLTTHGLLTGFGRKDPAGR